MQLLLLAAHVLSGHRRRSYFVKHQHLAHMLLVLRVDSKKLTEEQREAAFEAFMKQKDTFGYSWLNYYPPHLRFVPIM